MLITVDIPPVFGRVCYLNKQGKFPTVECYTSKVAYRLEISGYRLEMSGKVSIGDWVRVSGQTRIGKTRNKKTGLVDGIRSYYHAPYDGSSRSNWIFLELINSTCIPVGPAYLSDALIDAIEKGQTHIDNWSKTQDKDIILSTVDSFQKAIDALQKTLRQIIKDEEEKNAKPIRLPEISFADL